MQSVPVWNPSICLPIEALETLCSVHQAKQLKRQVVVSNRVKNMNTNIHNNVGHINAVIDEDVSVRFKYFDYDVKMERVFRRKGGWYEVSPLLLVYSDDNYYLVGCDHKDDKVRNFRVDRMAHLNGTGHPRMDKELFIKEELGLYQRYSFNMYNGTVEEVTMRFRNNMMNAVVDKFGRQNFVNPVDKDHFEITVPVAVSPQFFGWVFGLGNYVTIVGPKWVKEKMVEALEKVRKRY